MMHLSTDDYFLVFNRLENGPVEVSGSAGSLECFRQTVELAGYAEGLAGRAYVSGITELEDTMVCDEGTVALFLRFEALNYL